MLQITFMNLVDRFQIPVLEQIAIRNPQATTLGKRIIDGSIVLFDDLGFEHFTFKKLAQVVGTTEASVFFVQTKVVTLSRQLVLGKA